MRDHTASPKLPLSWGGFRTPTSIRTCSWKVLGSKSQVFKELERPGIMPWSWKILVSYMESPGKQSVRVRTRGDLTHLKVADTQLPNV